MKMILMMADAARLDAVRQDLRDAGAAGYTALPVLEGAGRTGLHSADRVHPGALVAILIVEPAERAGLLFDELVHRRDAAGDRVTRLFLVPVERQA
jgi:nitrogen regulatory protein PII